MILRVPAGVCMMCAVLAGVGGLCFLKGIQMRARIDFEEGDVVSDYSGVGIDMIVEDADHLADFVGRVIGATFYSKVFIAARLVCTEADDRANRELLAYFVHSCGCDVPALIVALQQELEKHPC